MGLLGFIKNLFGNKIDGPIKSNAHIYGTFNAYLYGPDGELKDERHANNIVTADGEAWIIDCMLASPVSAGGMSHMAVGTDNTAATTADTTLGTELYRGALTTAGGSAGPGGTADNIRYEITIASGSATGALVEAGIFAAAAAGHMLSRVVYAVINKGAADSLDITWDIEIKGV